jgi:N-acetylmuramoyl-L-alanine amidase
LRFTLSTVRRTLILVTVVALVLSTAPALTAAGNSRGPVLICLDPGHGGDDSGANYNGVMEKVPNLDIALRVRPILQSLGIAVKMTRKTDTTLSLLARRPLRQHP